MPRPVKTGSWSPGDIVNLLAVEVVNDLHHVDVLLVVHEEVLMASFDLHPVDVLLGVREVVLYGPASSASFPLSSARGPKTPVRTHSPFFFVFDFSLFLCL